MRFIKPFILYKSYVTAFFQANAAREWRISATRDQPRRVTGTNLRIQYLKYALFPPREAQRRVFSSIFLKDGDGKQAAVTSPSFPPSTPRRIIPF